MTVKELISKLQEIPQDLDVCIFDYLKTVHFATDEPTSEGIEPNFKVELINDADVNRPFVALSYENKDYADYKMMI